MAADSTQPLRVELGTVGERPCLRPVGEVDIASVAVLQEALARQLDGGQTRLVMDLQALSYLDSTGLGCITAARRRARDAGGDLVLICTQARILRLLSITGLDQVFTVCKTAAEAAAALSRGAQ
jgi:anti-sigma B factor antagonist